MKCYLLYFNASQGRCVLHRDLNKNILISDSKVRVCRFETKNKYLLKTILFLQKHCRQVRKVFYNADL